MNKAIIIVAGGTGSRMQSDIPKQFMLLKGKPLIFHTIEKFHAALPSCKIIVVLPSSQMSYWEEIKQQHSFSIALETTAGGKSRFESVKNGMQLIHEECVVGVHDAVRPLISLENIQLLFNEAEIKASKIFDPNAPKSRALTAIPFVGKDCPSERSEFAKPDVVISLTILAYRYEGLRHEDLRSVLKQLQQDLSEESGNTQIRPSFQKFAQWVKMGGGKVRGVRKDITDKRSGRVKF